MCLTMQSTDSHAIRQIPLCGMRCHGYPAVPRVDIKPSPVGEGGPLAVDEELRPRVDISKRMNDIVHTLARNIISFFGFFVNVKKR